MKIVAAIMDITIVKFWRYRDRIWLDSQRVKKCLVYDPRIVRVASCDIEKEK